MITLLFFLYRNTKLLFKTIRTHAKLIQFSGIQYRLLKFKAIFDPSVNLNEWLYNNQNVIK